MDSYSTLSSSTVKVEKPDCWYGTLALCIFNSGLCIFGDAILWRVRYERDLEKE
jgi:hypothetical protein